MPLQTKPISKTYSLCVYVREREREREREIERERNTHKPIITYNRNPQTTSLSLPLLLSLPLSPSLPLSLLSLGYNRVLNLLLAEASILGQSYDVDLLLKKELIDLKAIPLPGHSNGSPQPPKKFTAGTAMEKSVISGSRGKTKDTRVISVLELVGVAPTPTNSRTLITLVSLVFPLLLSKDGFYRISLST
eukprot:sb/3471095/